MGTRRSRLRGAVWPNSCSSSSLVLGAHCSRVISSLRSPIATAAGPGVDFSQEGRMRRIVVAVFVLMSGLVYAQQVTFERGDQVRVKPPADNAEPAASTLLLQVVAVPGDQVRADDSAVYVNDRAVAGFSPDFAARVASRPGM